MGKHFDALVEYTRNRLKSNIKCPGFPELNSRLECLVSKAALFELQFGAEKIRPTIGKDKEEYSLYLDDYLGLSKRFDKFLIKPFEITAVEDNDSVVILDGQREDKLFSIVCLDDRRMTNPVTYFSCAELSFMDKKVYKEALDSGEIQGTYDETGKWGFITTLRHCEMNTGGKTVYSNEPEFAQSAFFDLVQATTAYIEQIVYIMDPENFIIRKESNQSRSFREKRGESKSKKIGKTVMRPHYICLSETDLRDFITREAKEPRAAHPVRGHWRKLRSEKYVNKKGHSIFIPQYFTGNGSIQARGGWNYQVMIKEGPDKIAEYKQKEYIS